MGGYDVKQYSDAGRKYTEDDTIMMLEDLIDTTDQYQCDCAHSCRHIFVTDVACKQRTLTLPDTWFRPFLGLAYTVLFETSFPELTMSFLDFSTRYFFDFAFYSSKAEFI